MKSLLRTWSLLGRHDGYHAPAYKPEPRYHNTSDYGTRRDYRSSNDYRPTYKPHKRDGYGY